VVSRDSVALYQGFPMMGKSRAQIWSYAPNYRRPRHFHAEPELNLVVSGAAVFEVGTKRVTVRAGELLSFAPGQDHVLLAGTPELELFAVALRSDFSKQVLGVTEPVIVDFSLSRLEPNAFREVVRHVTTYTERENNDSPIAELWERFWHLRQRTSENADKTHVLTRRALTALLGNPTLDRNALAECTRGNPSELSRHFHRDLGITLVEYRARLRILEFIRQVDSGILNLTTASVSAGFGSYSQCHRQFFAQLGTAPQDFFRGGARERMEHVFLPTREAPVNE
jgi:AraC-like DNA-binding protein